MENLKQDLELLYGLQDYDIKIDKIREKIYEVPLLIEKKRNILENKKAEVKEKKKNFVKLNSLEKEKEALLDSKEKEIDKYSNELNAVKSNDIYKKLLLEIEKAKTVKNTIEDEFLNLINKIDEKYIVVKTAEDELKKFEQEIKDEIIRIENSAKELEIEVKETEKEREKHKLKINKAVLAQYERLRAGRKEQRGICIIEGESCGGCGMLLRPQLINQVQKYRELVFCDNCSRILLKK